MLTKLTPEQEAEIPRYVREWTETGLSTRPANRAEAEDGVRLAYESANLKPPKLLVWLGSPMAGCIGAEMIRNLFGQVRARVRAQVRDQVGAQVFDQVFTQVGDQVGAQVFTQVGDQVFDQVFTQVGDQVFDQVFDQVGAQVRAQVFDQVFTQVGAQVRDQVGARVRAQVFTQVFDQVRDQVYKCGYGQHDASWIGFYAFFREQCAIHSKKLEGLENITKNCGWFWPFEGLCILTERPNALVRDDVGRLHNLIGSALRYPDGWSIFAVHGVRVPEYVIVRPSEITVEDIQNESNQEIKRIKIDRYGQSRYLIDAGAKQIHADDFGTLFTCHVQNDEPLVMVKVVNATPELDGSSKDYFIRVPPTMKRARQAVAWTFRKKEMEYAPCLET